MYKDISLGGGGVAWTRNPPNTAMVDGGFLRPLVMRFRFRPLVNCSGRLFTDLRRRLHPQGDRFHGGRTASHPVERHAALLQGKRSGGQQAAAQAVAAPVDGRPPDRHDHRRDRPCRRGWRQRLDQTLAAGRVARVQRRWRCVIPFRRLSARCQRGDGGVGGDGGLVRASPIIHNHSCAHNNPSITLNVVTVYYCLW